MDWPPQRPVLWITEHWLFHFKCRVWGVCVNVVCFISFVFPVLTGNDIKDGRLWPIRLHGLSMWYKGFCDTRIQNTTPVKKSQTRSTLIQGRGLEPDRPPLPPWWASTPRRLLYLQELTLQITGSEKLTDRTDSLTYYPEQLVFHSCSCSCTCFISSPISSSHKQCQCACKCAEVCFLNRAIYTSLIRPGLFRLP